MAAPASDAESSGASGSAFFSFPSFDSSLERGVKNMRRLAPDTCDNAEWVGVEKVHGSNFSVTFGEGSDAILYASRTQYLDGPGKSFFNHGVVMRPYEGALLSLAKALRGGKEPAPRVQVWGELYGGSVQTVNAVIYSPHVDWRAFDVFVSGVPLNRDVMFALFAEHKVPFFAPRARGKMADLLAMDPAFVSEIWTTYPAGSMPAPDPKKNLAEGMVIQPVEPVTVIDDGTPVRIMIKHKNKNHLEVTVKVAKPVKAPASKDAPELSSLPAPVQALIEKALCYVTLTRLGNYLSKIGEYSEDMRAKTVSGLVQDAFVDLSKEVEGDEKKLLTSQQKSVRPHMQAQANAVLDSYIESIKK